MRPRHMETGQSDGDEDIHECLAEEAEAEESGQQVGHKAVQEVVEHAQAQTSPARTEAPNTLKQAHRRGDLGCDRLVVDDSNFQIGVSVSLGRH